MAADSEHGIHVLLLPYPSQGHINPILQFGKRLASHSGVRCTLAVTRYILGQSRAPSPGAVHVAEISDGFDRGGFGEAGGDVDAYLALLESAGSRTVDELLRSESDHGRPVHAVVYDAFLPWAQPVVRRHGAACASFFTQAPAVNVAYAHARAGRMRLPVLGEVPLEFPGLPAGIRTDDLPTFLTEPTDCPAYLDLLFNQFQGLDTAEHVLVNSFHELQPLESEYMATMWRAKTVGLTVPSAYLDNRLRDDTSYGFHLHTPTTATTREWLDARAARSVAYVSFGSIATPSPAQMFELAEGLHSSGAAFLWVVRASETSKIPDGFADRAAASERGLIVTWTAQLEVLAHPAVGCFVTHCGWNSTTEGLSAGVPMVAAPQWSDQTMNAKYIEDVWRVGVRARPDEGGVVRKEEVERCVREVMEGERSQEYVKNAIDWKEKARRAMSEGGSSDNNIVEFLGKLGSRTCEQSRET